MQISAKSLSSKIKPTELPHCAGPSRRVSSPTRELKKLQTFNQSEARKGKILTGPQDASSILDGPRKTPKAQQRKFSENGLDDPEGKTRDPLQPSVAYRTFKEKTN
jgi:hypothetical protein